MTAPADYIRAYMPDRPIKPGSTALVMIDLQYATGSRHGALGRKLQAEGSTIGNYRFDRIESHVVPNSLRLRAHFRAMGRPILHVTIGAAHPDALDAPPHMRKLFVEFRNFVGSREHEILDELKPLSGEHVLRKTTIGAFASMGMATLLIKGRQRYYALIFIGLPFVVRTVQPVLEDAEKELEEAATCLGATRWQTFRLVILPSITPALMTGFAMAFARAVGEYGSVIFIAGNMPMVSEITPLIIIGKLEQYDYAGATAVAVVMLVISFILLLVINALQAWQRRHAGAPA